MNLFGTRSSRHSGSVVAVATVALSITLSACGAGSPAQPATAPTRAVVTNPTLPAAKPALGPTAPASKPALGPTAPASKPTTAPATAPTAAAAGKPTGTAPTTVPATNPTAPPTQGSTGATKPTSGTFTPRPLAAAVTLKGSGASFPAPLYQSWIEQYKGMVKDLSLDYQSVGSGQGVKDFLGGIVAFGATDAALTAEQLKQAPDTLHVPMALGSVAVIYNLDGVSDLHLSPATLAGIFQGTIKKWNDPQILADNKGVTLPDAPITVVHRADGSGTSNIFTSYLSSADPGWKSAVGAGTTVQWPTGTGAEKNDGVAAAVKQTRGAIGYVELSYALSQTPALPVAAIKNAGGAFVTPSVASTTAAAATLKDVPSDLRMSIVNPAEGKDAYPISGYTWILLHGTMKDKAQAEALTDFLYWALTEGGVTAAKLHYAPLPPDIQQRAIAQLGKVMVDGKPAFTAPASQARAASHIGGLAFRSLARPL